MYKPVGWGSSGGGVRMNCPHAGESPPVRMVSGHSIACEHIAAVGHGTQSLKRYLPPKNKTTKGSDGAAAGVAGSE